MIGWEEMEMTVCASGLVEVDHWDFPAPIFFRLLFPSKADAALNASRSSQPSQTLRGESLPAGDAERKNCREQSSQNLSSRIWNPAWTWCSVAAIFVGLILGFLQGGH